MASGASAKGPYFPVLNRLIGDFQPARRILPVNIRLGLWLVLEFSMFAMVALAVPRPDLGSALLNPHYVLPLGIFAIVGAAGGSLALRSSVPGLEASGSQIGSVSIAALVALAVAVAVPANTEITLRSFIGAGIKCLACTWIFALLPWIVLFWTVKRAAPLRGYLAGGLVGVAAFSFAFTATRLGCPIDDSLHVLMWHILPGIVGVALSAVAGQMRLSRYDFSRYRYGAQRNPS
jgi:hypothetical protein